MARPVKKNVESFLTSTKLLYDTRIKALRLRFRNDGHANDAFFVFDYIFREILGNEGYYIKYNADLIIGAADFCYVSEPFVNDVIQQCIDLELFDEMQFEQNKILTSRAVQNKYRATIDAMKRAAVVESRFCVSEEVVSSKNQGVSSEKTGVSSENLELTPTRETNVRDRREREKKETPPPGEVQHHFSVFLAAWDALANDENAPVKAAKRKWEAMNAPDSVIRNYLARCQEYGEATVLAAVAQLRNAKFWHSKTIGLPTMLDEQKFQKLIDGEYDNLFENAKERPHGNKPSTLNQPNEDERVKREQQLTGEQRIEYVRRFGSNFTAEQINALDPEQRAEYERLFGNANRNAEG
jgi:hypothetical protein